MDGKRRPRLRRKRSSRSAAAGPLAALLVALAAVEPGSETLVLSAAYPSPAGIYGRLVTTGGTTSDPQDTLLGRDAGQVIVGPLPAAPNKNKLVVTGGVRVDWTEHKPYSGAGPGIAGPGLLASEEVSNGGSGIPAPGRVFYNLDLDQFYHTSKTAQAGDPSTWYKPLSGIDMVPASKGALAANSPPLTKSAKNLSPWSASLGYPACSGACVMSELQTKAGLFTLELSATYCDPANPNTDASPVVNVFWSRCNSAGGNCGGWHQAAQFSDAITLDAAGCGDLEVSGMFLFSSINQRFRVKATAKKDPDGGPAQQIMAGAPIGATRFLRF